MRKLAIVLAAVLAAGAFAPAAFAQDDDAPKNDKGKMAERAKAADMAKTRAEAMGAAPGLLQQAGVSCTVSDAVSKGQAKADNGSGKKVNTKFYEAACSDGPGYIIIAPEGGTASAYTCLTVAGDAKSSTKCELPGNADPNKGFEPLLAKASVQCQVTKGRYVGTSTTDKTDFYELGCANGSAYVLTAPRAGSARPLAAQSCALQILSGTTQCTYLTKADAVKSMAALAAGANRTACQINDVRYIGNSTETKDAFYEMGCTDGKSGYVIELTPANTFKSAIDCTRASGIGGGCTLSQVDLAETSDASTYTKVSGDAGYPCQVQKYHSIGLDPTTHREIVELACAGKPASVIAFLPIDKGQTLDVWNCARAESRGLRCALSPIASTYAIMSEQATSHRQECQVNQSRAVGSTPEGKDYVEVGCTNGGALMFEYNPGADKLNDVFGCAQAKGVGGGCKLNKKS